MLTIGTMTGTSKDAIDVVLIETDGFSQVKESGFYSLPYNENFKMLLNAAEFAVNSQNGDMDKAKNSFQAAVRAYLKNKIMEVNMEEKMQAMSAYMQKAQIADVSFDDVVHHLTQLHADAIKTLLQKCHKKAEEIDLIGFHGQTLYHNPAKGITIQVGDGQWLADEMNILVIDQFRKRDVAMGGQGAPFAPVFLQALVLQDKIAAAAILNCGGIANVAFISQDNIEKGFDTGPGNGLVDSYIRKITRGKEAMDDNGKYGLHGTVNETILEQLFSTAALINNENYFEKLPPKSLDINNLKLSSETEAALNKLSLEDACRTLETFTAESIVRCLQWLDKEKIPNYWILYGGGWNNPVIKKELTDRLTTRFQQLQLSTVPKIVTADEIGWHSQAVEAKIFAYLAARSLKNLPTSYPKTTGVPEPVVGGEGHKPASGYMTEEVNSWLDKNPALFLQEAPQQIFAIA